MKIDVIRGKVGISNGFHSRGFQESCRKEAASSESGSGSSASSSSTFCLSSELSVGSVLLGPSSASCSSIQLKSLCQCYIKGKMSG